MNDPEVLGKFFNFLSETWVWVVLFIAFIENAGERSVTTN